MNEIKQHGYLNYSKLTLKLTFGVKCNITLTIFADIILIYELNFVHLWCFIKIHTMHICFFLYLLTKRLIKYHKDSINK